MSLNHGCLKRNFLAVGVLAIALAPIQSQATASPILTAESATVEAIKAAIKTANVAVYGNDLALKLGIAEDPETSVDLAEIFAETLTF